MIIRSVTPTDGEAWLDLRSTLWPDSRHAHKGEIAGCFSNLSDSSVCVVAEEEGGGLVGFAEIGLRAYAEGCLSSPVGYLEGIFVLPAHRGRGVGRALVRAGERWAAGRGCTEMASDRELGNEASGFFHEALGYEEVERIVCFRKPLAPTEEAA